MTQWQWSVVCALIRVVLSNAHYEHSLEYRKQYDKDYALIKEALSPERNRG